MEEMLYFLKPLGNFKAFEIEKDKIGALGANLLDKNMNIIHSYGNFAGYKIALTQLIEMFFSNILLSILYILVFAFSCIFLR